MKTFLLLPILVLLVGCGTLDKGGVYSGDKVAYDSELAVVTAHDFFQTYVKWEYDNRASLSGTPEIKKSADFIRANARRWEQSAINLTEAYKAQPNDANRNALIASLQVLQAALVEAAGYMTQVTTGAH